MHLVVVDDIFTVVCGIYLVTRVWGGGFRLHSDLKTHNPQQSPHTQRVSQVMRSHYPAAQKALHKELSWPLVTDEGSLEGRLIGTIKGRSIYQRSGQKGLYTRPPKVRHSPFLKQPTWPTSP